MPPFYMTKVTFLMDKIPKFITNALNVNILYILTKIDRDMKICKSGLWPEDIKIGGRKAFSLFVL